MKKLAIWPPQPRSLIEGGTIGSHTRVDMNSEPSHQAIDNEIAYRWGQEVSAMGRLSDAELETVYKNGWKPSEYLANK